MLHLYPSLRNKYFCFSLLLPPFSRQACFLSLLLIKSYGFYVSVPIVVSFNVLKSPSNFESSLRVLFLQLIRSVPARRSCFRGGSGPWYKIHASKTPPPVHYLFSSSADIPSSRESLQPTSTPASKEHRRALEV
ncbi:uncharacterized protein K444DRAFT_427741 [Hyaloscypha bicolor E]|uniref:Uncharacterized protein n=1 Tax=Hyaloscypha bicolor E TaxID=1095630 RepID=A0A2J6T888_9HELO|nr:uncharacterized protein K444DRAFT_427741 [Hyaloscypha bicolor E]PMD59231.1 hypothetical protein K444DRAFT_427741 [Hyaloscypha bicolor E]